MLEDRSIPIPQKEISSEIKQKLEGGRPSKKEVDSCGLWQSNNYMRLRDGEILDPNKIIGAKIFIKDLKLGASKLAKDIKDSKGQERRSFDINGKNLEVIYSERKMPDKILCDGYEIDLRSNSEINTIIWERDGIHNVIDINRYTFRVPVVCERQTRDGKILYGRLSAPAGDLEARVEIDLGKYKANYYVGKAKMKEREGLFIMGPPQKEFKIALFHAVKNGENAWLSINQYLRTRFDDGAGITNCNINGKDVEIFMKEHKSNPRYIFR